MRKILYLLFILLFGIKLYAQDISVSATISSKNVAVGDQISYAITIAGKAQGLPRPNLPKLPAFQVYNSGTQSSFQFVNGQISSSVTYNYTLIPQKAGTFTIGSAQIQYKSKIYQTQPITITVSKVKQKKPSPQGKTSVEERIYNQKHESDIFVRTLVNKSSAYVNEPVIFSHKIYYRNLGISRSPQKKPQEFTGFLAEDIPPPKRMQRKIEMYKGQKYYTLTIERKILIPNTPGKKYIKGAEFYFVIEDFLSIFPRQIKKIANPISINVKSLPENKPVDFNGTVGSYRMKAKLSTKNITQNQPFSLKVVISGSGNIKSISKPKEPEFQNFRIYDTHSSINISKGAGGITGNKTFEYILIPQSAGNLKIEPFSFSYFNYSKKKYETLKTKAFIFKVKPGKGNFSNPPIYQPQRSDVELIGKDIRFIKENIKKIVNQGDYFFNNGLFIFLILLPLLLLGGSFYYYQYQMKMESDVTFAKASRAYKTARKQLIQIDKDLKNQKYDQIALLFEKLITNYISNKFNIPVTNIVIDQIKKILTQKKLPVQLISEIEELYHEMNMLRYSPAEANEQNFQDFYLRSNEIINKIEQQIKI